MLKKIRLERFKNFKKAELIVGNLTILVGKNASGKSNIRDAFRFFHGISRGYSLAKISGRKRTKDICLQCIRRYAALSSDDCCTARATTRRLIFF